MESWAGKEGDSFEDQEWLDEDAVEKRGRRFIGGCDAYAFGSLWSSSVAWRSSVNTWSDVEGLTDLS
jgi:hypothetical protein